MGSIMSRVLSFWYGQSSEDTNSDLREPYEELIEEALAAVDKGDCDALKALHLQGYLLSGVEYLSVMPPLIHRAAGHGHEEVIRFLIDLGVNVDEADTCGVTALHEACKKKHFNCVQLLVSKSRDIDRRDVWGRTPLIKALVYRNTQAVELLLEKGANPNAIDIYGITPLSTAIDYNLLDMVRLLVRHGADVNLITQHMYKCSGPPLYQATNNQNVALIHELIRLGATTQPRVQESLGRYNAAGASNSPWQYFSSPPIMVPSLYHPNAVVMAIGEIVRRGHNNLDTMGPGMEILMALLAAHGHPLDHSTDVLIRVLVNSRPDDFSMLLHKLQVCSSSSDDNFLAMANDRDSNQRPPARPLHLQQMDQHLRDGNGGRKPPRAVMSLHNQARRVVRQAVMASGRNVVWATKRLQCPPALKSVLLLKDIDRAYSVPVLNKPFLTV